MTKSKSSEEGIKSFGQLGLEGDELVKTVEVTPEKLDFSKEDEALGDINNFLLKNKNLSREERETINELRIIIQTVKLEKKKGKLQKPLNSEEVLLWDQFQAKHGKSWEILNTPPKKDPEIVSEKNEGLPGLEIEKVNFTSLEKALKEIRRELSNNIESTLDSKKYSVLLKAEVALRSILDFFKKKLVKEPSSESINLWKEFEGGKGEVFEALNFRKETKQEPKKIEKINHPDFSFGQQVKIKNESGEIEEGWVFQEIRNGNVAMVTKKGPNGTRLKNVSLKEFKKWNSENGEITKTPEKSTKETEEKKPEKVVEKPKEAIVKKEEKPEEKSEEKPKEFSPEIKAKLDTLGITQEALRGMADFEKIAGSEGKVLSVLEKVSHLRLKTIERDATADYEKHVREGKGFFQKVGRSFLKTKKIQSRKYEHEKVPL
ncbi:MAG: hypothetical protein WC629_02875, partial [Candidatus Paceibacterota bacterium]